MPFASFNLENILQILAFTLAYGISVVGAPVCYSSFFLLAIFGSEWIRLLLLLYLVFMYYDRHTPCRGGRRASWLPYTRLWHYVCNYFPTKLVKTSELDPSRNHLIVCFPHGVTAAGLASAFVTNGADRDGIFPGFNFRVALLNFHFFVPFYREYQMCFNLFSASEKGIDYLLSGRSAEFDKGEKIKSGRAVVLIAGGASEAMYSEPGTYRILLKRRKGFVRVALRHGTPLVPVFSFGETDYYTLISFPDGSIIERLQLLMKRLTGIFPALFNGRGVFQDYFGFLPRRTPINIVVGSPIEIPKIEEPSSDEIDKYHAIFTEQLIELFETHKSKYVKDYEKVSLVLVE